MPGRSSARQPPPARPASSSTNCPPIPGGGRRCARRWEACFRFPSCGHGRYRAWSRTGAARAQIIAAVPRGGTPMYDADLSRPAAILLGGEGAGLPVPIAGGGPTRQHPDARQDRIPQRGGRCGSPPLRGTTPTPHMSLFDDAPVPVDPKTIPLAERMRPRTLDEVVGQDDLVAPGRPLREVIDRDLLQSIILWGPPGHRQDDTRAHSSPRSDARANSWRSAPCWPASRR